MRFDHGEVVSLDVDERGGKVVVGLLKMDVARSVLTGLELSDEESTLVEFRRDDVVTPVRQQTGLLATTAAYRWLPNRTERVHYDGWGVAGIRAAYADGIALHGN